MLADSVCTGADAGCAWHGPQHVYHFDDGSETGIYVLYTNGGTFSNRLRAHAAARSLRGHAEEQRSLDCATCCVECSGPHCCPQCPPCVAPTGTCNGEEAHGNHSTLPFVQPAGNCTSTLCAVFATSLDGPWHMRNVDSPCTNNAVPFQVSCMLATVYSCCRSFCRSVRAVHFELCSLTLPVDCS